MQTKVFKIQLLLMLWCQNGARIPCEDVKRYVLI